LMSMLLPNLIIAGAPKCGTTALFCYLAAHPEVCASSEKETCFLMDAGYPLYRPQCNIDHLGIEGYRQFFSHCKGGDSRIYLEATPDYLYQETALRVLSGFDPQPKVVFILRKPSERIYSLFRFAQNNMAVLDASISFKKFLEMVECRDPSLRGRDILLNAIDHSDYAIHLEKWFTAFGRERVKVLLFEELVADPRALMEELCRWLELEPEFYEGFDFQKQNEAVTVKSQAIHYWRRRIARYLPAGLKPKGLRALYDRLNITRGGVERSAEEQVTLARLDQRFAEGVEWLGVLTGLDFSTWSQTREGGRGENCATLEKTHGE